MILAKGLNESGLPIEAVLVPHYGYPKDESILNGADTIVIFCTGHGGHVLNPKLKQFDALMKKGTGGVMIHWATEAIKGDPGNKFLEWMGGFCDLNWSVNPHWTPNFKAQKHPIWNGVKPFSVNDEWYYHMRFVKDLKGVTPILTDVPRDAPMIVEESFGPLAPIMAVSDIEDAIDLANATAYGLSSGIVTSDMKRAIQAVKGIQTGTVNINQVPGYRIECSPFGGVKDSGLGVKEGVIEAMKGMTYVKTFSMPW